MQVQQFWRDARLEAPVDVFVTEPFDFEQEYSRAWIKPLHDLIEVRFASAGTLIRMKSAAGRPQDHLDVENLRIIVERRWQMRLRRAIRRSTGA